ncbi:MAG TPA: HD domain-containing protein, partial [Chroococcales cyanobacterium]
MEHSKGIIRHRLMLALEDLTHPDQLLVTRALKLAEEVHARQYRRPLKIDPLLKIAYINHPMRVALILIEEMQQKNPDLIAAALLHDVVEDSNGKVTTAMLEQEFGRTVALMVSVLTKPPVDKKIPRAKQLETYHERVVNANSQTRLIKLCDRTDNMREALEAEDE